MLPKQKSMKGYLKHTPMTALDWLLHHRIITEEMHEACNLYAEICHARPAGGPSTTKCSLGLQNYYPLKSRNLEPLWRDLHQTLQRSSIHRLIIAIIEEDNHKILARIYQSPTLQSLLRSTLREMTFCLKTHEDELPRGY